jgi:hypothetical protein
MMKDAAPWRGACSRVVAGVRFEMRGIGHPPEPTWTWNPHP